MFELAGCDFVCFGGECGFWVRHLWMFGFAGLQIVGVCLGCLYLFCVMLLCFAFEGFEGLLGLRVQLFVGVVIVARLWCRYSLYACVVLVSCGLFCCV